MNYLSLMSKMALSLLVVCGTSSFAQWGEWYQPDDEIAGMSRRKLEQTADCFYFTSKGRELEWISGKQYAEGLFVQKLKVSAAILKDENEKTVKEFQRIIALEENALHGTVDSEQKIKPWLEQNCRPGTTLYYYKHTSKKFVRGGYCLVRDGVVINSLILGTGPNEAYEKARVAEEKLREKEWEIANEGPIKPDFSKYPQTAAFKYYLNGQIDAMEHLSHADLLAISAFPEGNKYALQYVVDENGNENDYRNVYNWAFQGIHLKQLSKVDFKSLRLAICDLPSKNVSPPIERLVIVSFKHGANWVTRSFDSRTLPKPMRQIYNIIGERSESKRATP